MKVKLHHQVVVSSGVWTEMSPAPIAFCSTGLLLIQIETLCRARDNLCAYIDPISSCYLITTTLQPTQVFNS